MQDQVPGSMSYGEKSVSNSNTSHTSKFLNSEEGEVHGAY